MAEIKPDSYIPSQEEKPKIFEVTHDIKEPLKEVPVNQESLNQIRDAKPVFSSPEHQAEGVVEETLEQFDHAKAQDDKKQEAIQLEKLLADDHDDIMNFASETQDDANEFGQIKQS